MFGQKHSSRFRCTIFTRMHTTRSKGCRHCTMSRLGIPHLCHVTLGGKRIPTEKNTIFLHQHFTDTLVFSLLPPPLVILLQRLVLSSPFSPLFSVWMGGLKFVFQQIKMVTVTSRWHCVDLKHITRHLRHERAGEDNFAIKNREFEINMGPALF